ncbi:MAG: hypothetical protein EZS28_043843, partial [Streblomastix strix]
MEVEIGGDMKVMKKKKKKKSINQSNIDLTDGKKHKISDSRITLIMRRSSVDKDKDKKEDGFDEYEDGRKEKKNKTNLKDKQQQQQQQQQQGGSARVNISNNYTIERSSSTKKRYMATESQLNLLLFIEAIIDFAWSGACITAAFAFIRGFK